MSDWPDRRLIDLFGIRHPILQAPMAGASGVALAVAVSRAGGLGALPCALLSPDEVLAQVEAFRQEADGPLNLNFFCHTPPDPDPEAEAAWIAALAPYYAELGLDPEAPRPASSRAPFDEAFCALVETVRPAVVSFHFGLPAPDLLARVRASGARIISSATTVEEAVWLAERGCDAVIAMGFEAGGHRASFLTRDMNAQPGTFALVPQIVDAVDVPVIAAGGVADGRGMAAALALGAAGVQVGTAYLRSPESLIPDFHRQALASARDDGTAVTNLFTGRPARGLYNRLMAEIGPMSTAAPPFPTAAGALAPLRAARPGADFSNQWAGQAAALAQPIGAEDITLALAQDALDQLARLSGRPRPA
ncbi:nitronate monooxygenase family protein [Phenylobacterium sp.]|uniref:NAD(P)H-dependent flavin oxidoreductase n=1 Tax=Phenylobacterium sp. TaxID=1871053 RepID=UPI0027318349|nr:nitronate monooxygenase family protein [Phenylobacterium sp.]MDP1619095.1 nitronate monooxygenase family protein [Phenylobacterium sp.]MDP1986194.1 nitronate monooxygenase family protein [Phenylobacterium sp.]